MLPPILAHQIQDGIADFLRSTFPPANPFFATMLDRFLAEPGMLFKGPYHSLKLPFRPGTAGTDVLKGIKLPFPPYLHQQRSFDRLRGEKARPTLVATGTGSGETECFLYPILEHCLSHPAEKGIKAIIIYPMNALATDQAKRLAGIIDDQLKGRITAGLYVGGETETSSVTLLSEAEFLGETLIARTKVPGLADVEKMRPENFALPKDYLAAQYALWFDEAPPADLEDRDWRIVLGDSGGISPSCRGCGIHSPQVARARGGCPSHRAKSCRVRAGHRWTGRPSGGVRHGERGAIRVQPVGQPPASPALSWSVKPEEEH